MTRAQSRFYALLERSPGGVIDSDIQAILNEECDPSEMPNFIRACRGLFRLCSETDEEGDIWYHLKDPPPKPGKRLLVGKYRDENKYNKKISVVGLPKSLYAKARKVADKEGLPVRALVIEAVEMRLRNKGR